MINGFLEQTQELTEAELKMIPVFVQGFSKKIGKENAVTGAEIISKLKPTYKLTGARVRKIVNYIRNEGLVPGLIASSLGYYVSNDPVEIETYCESLRQRSNAIQRVMRSFQNHLIQLKQTA
jgi:hypothetical protein